MPGAATIAREAGDAFAFTTHALLEWFSSEEISRIEAEAYRSQGGAIATRPLWTWQDPRTPGWLSVGQPATGNDSDGGLIQLSLGPDPRLGQPGPADFVPRAPLGPGIEVALVDDRGESGRVAMYLRVDGRAELLAFIHLTPDPYRSEPRAWRERVALTIAGQMLRRMRWIEWAAPSGSTPLPDIVTAAPGDDGRAPLPLGAVTDAPGSARLDFLFQLCASPCFRDAHWIDPDDPTRGSGVWTAGRPFHVREGFPTDGQGPLGQGFDVVLYVTRIDPSDGVTYRYEADYRLAGTSDRCGPTYLGQRGPVTCEWFVHDFPDGLPEGRWAVWAYWEAPCWAWLEYGQSSSCDDPTAVSSRFSSGFDGPVGQRPPEFDEISDLARPAGAGGQRRQRRRQR